MHPCFSDVLSPCSLRRCSRSHSCSPSVLPNVINENVLYLLYLGLPTIIQQQMEPNNSIRPVQSPSNPIALLTAFSSLPFACITAFEALGSEQAQLLAISHLLQPRPPPPPPVPPPLVCSQLHLSPVHRQTKLIAITSRFARCVFVRSTTTTLAPAAPPIRAAWPIFSPCPSVMLL